MLDFLLKIEKLNCDLINYLLELDYKKLYKKIFKIICLILVIYLVFETTQIIADASLVKMFGEPEGFKDLTNTAKYKYMTSAYRNNYYLDTVDPGTFDYIAKAANFMSNIFWDIAVGTTYILILLFYVTFDLNLSQVFETAINSALEQIKLNIFDVYIYLAIALGLVEVVILFWKRNTVGMFKKIGYMGLVIAVSMILSKYAATITSNLTTFSKDIGASSITAIKTNELSSDPRPDAQAQAEVLNSSEAVSGEIWYNMVHQPWLQIEGVDSDEAEELLTREPKSDDRKDKVEKINDKDNNKLAADAGEERLIPVMFVGVINIIKIIILVILCAFSVLFQFLTILLVFLVPIILLFSIIPGMGGVNLVAKCGKHILGFQIGIIFTSFIIAMLLKTDSLIASAFPSSTFGYIFVSAAQLLIYAVVIWQRERIFDLLKDLQSAIGSTRAANVSDLIKNKIGGHKEDLTNKDDVEGKSANVESEARVIEMPSEVNDNMVKSRSIDFNNNMNGSSSINAKDIVIEEQDEELRHTPVDLELSNVPPNNEMEAVQIQDSSFNDQQAFEEVIKNRTDFEVQSGNSTQEEVKEIGEITNSINKNYNEDLEYRDFEPDSQSISINSGYRNFETGSQSINIDSGYRNFETEMQSQSQAQAQVTNVNTISHNPMEGVKENPRYEELVQSKIDNKPGSNHKNINIRYKEDRNLTENLFGGTVLDNKIKKAVTDVKQNN